VQGGSTKTKPQLKLLSQGLASSKVKADKRHSISPRQLQIPNDGSKSRDLEAGECHESPDPRHQARSSLYDCRFHLRLRDLYCSRWEELPQRTGAMFSTIAALLAFQDHMPEFAVPESTKTLPTLCPRAHTGHLCFSGS
jgi:hypothetical protein